MKTSSQQISFLKAKTPRNTNKQSQGTCCGAAFLPCSILTSLMKPFQSNCGSLRHQILSKRLVDWLRHSVAFDDQFCVLSQWSLCRHVCNKTRKSPGHSTKSRSSTRILNPNDEDPGVSRRKGFHLEPGSRGQISLLMLPSIKSGPKLIPRCQVPAFLNSPGTCFHRPAFVHVTCKCPDPIITDNACSQCFEFSSRLKSPSSSKANFQGQQHQCMHEPRSGDFLKGLPGEKLRVGFTLGRITHNKDKF